MIMGWMMDQYSIIRRQISPAVVTGKPLTMGGSAGRDGATATGAYFVMQAILPKFDLVASQTTVAVQGFGKAGAVIAELLYKAGYKVLAVSDSQGGIYSSKGLDIPSIRQFKASGNGIKALYCQNSVCNLVDHEVLTNEELLGLDVDVLIPAALENQINETNVNNIKARYIFEVANGPVTSAADKILSAKGIYVFPDILVNAGGVTVSYFEWVQNRSGLYWTLEEVNQRLKQKIVEETERIWSISQELAISMRTAAYVHALNRLGEALNAKGTRDYYINGRVF
jgi:glutamate dehydrogenase (NADP+)